MSKNEKLRAPVPEEPGVPRPVTELTLFPNRPGYWNRVDQYTSAFTNIVAKSERADSAFHRFQGKMDSIGDRLTVVMSEAIEERRNSLASISAGKAYVKIFEKLSQEGVSEKDIMRFFKTCLTINTLQSDSFRGKTMDEAVRRVNLDSSSYSRMQALPRAQAVARVDEQPWYWGKKGSWSDFVFLNSNFAYVVNPDSILVTETKGALTLMPKTLYEQSFETIEDAYPDWVRGLDEGAVKMEEVKDELADDEASLDYQTQKLNVIRRQTDTLNKSIFSKSLKSARFSANLRKEASGQISSFPNLITFVANTDRYMVDPTVFDYYDVNSDEDRIRFNNRSAISPKNAVEGEIENFINKNPFQTEFLALWFERKMHDMGVRTMTDIVDPSHIAVLFTAGEERQSLMQVLKLKSKKAHDTLKFGIIPFFDELGPDDKDYLSSYVSGANISYDELIMELAEVLSLKIAREGINNTSSEFNKRESEFKKFAKNITLNNYRWFWEEMKRARVQGYTHSASEPVQDSELLEISEDLHKEEKVRVQEVEASNLSGWDVFYARKRQVDSDHLVRLEGDTLETLEESLKEFMAAEGISFPIKISSAINALDDYVGLSDNIHIRKRKTMINGEVFDKIKRGRDGRIFVKMDREKHELIFFLYGKTDYYYDFPHTNL